MATKKKTSRKTTKKAGITKVAEKIAAIAGTIVGNKNRLLKKATIAIDTVKSKVLDLTATKKVIGKKAKKAVKKAEGSLKATARNAASKVAKKASAVKKKSTRAVTKVTKKAQRVAKKATAK